MKIVVDINVMRDVLNQRVIRLSVEEPRHQMSETCRLADKIIAHHLVSVIEREMDRIVRKERCDD